MAHVEVQGSYTLPCRGSAARVWAKATEPRDTSDLRRLLLRN